ncbi:MAG: head decoration protein [Comamonadaceae bacterium]|nr:MAG: head decoration protein [Comamonadaceae bacterium]
MRAEYRTEGTYVPDALIAGNAHLLVGRKVIVAAGATLKRGALLGKITTGGKYALSASAASDGSQTPDLILAEDIDASGGDVQALAYARGDFNARAITLGVGHTIASITEGLRAKGITLLPTVA